MTPRSPKHPESPNPPEPQSWPLSTAHPSTGLLAGEVQLEQVQFNEKSP